MRSDFSLNIQYYYNINLGVYTTAYVLLSFLHEKSHEQVALFLCGGVSSVKRSVQALVVRAIYL